MSETLLQKVADLNNRKKALLTELKQLEEEINEKNAKKRRRF